MASTSDRPERSAPAPGARSRGTLFWVPYNSLMRNGFNQLAELLEREVRAPLARRLLSTIRKELAGTRLTIPARAAPTISDQQIQAALTESGYSVDKAADRLGVHVSTLYRRLNARQQQRQRPQRDPGPTFNGRPLR